MKIRKDANIIDLNQVDFYGIMRIMRDTARRLVQTKVEWARVFITDEGRAFAQYKAGDNTRLINTDKKSGALNIVEWLDKIGDKYIFRRFYQVDLSTLDKKDGIAEEAQKARQFINKAYDQEGNAVELTRQRSIELVF